MWTVDDSTYLEICPDSEDADGFLTLFWLSPSSYSYNEHKLSTQPDLLTNDIRQFIQFIIIWCDNYRQSITLYDYLKEWVDETS